MIRITLQKLPEMNKRIKGDIIYIMQSLPSFSVNEFLAQYVKITTPRRFVLLKALSKKAWFQATDPSIQKELAMLPAKGKENYDGFLESIIRRKEEIGGVRTLRLLKLSRAHYTLCPMFEVQKIQTGEIYTYDFAAYRHGVPAGFKGLVFIRPDKKSEPTHMILLSGEKFATGEKGYELLGGLPEVDLNERQEVVKGVMREIREETGVKNLEIDEVKLLGTLVVDPGHTSHETNLFAAYISSSEALHISKNAKNIDDYELDSQVHIVPLSRVKNIVRKTNNSLLLAAFSKALSTGLIPVHYYTDLPS